MKRAFSAAASGSGWASQGLPIPHRSIPTAHGQDLDFINLFHSHLININAPPSSSSSWPSLLPLTPSLTPFRLLHLLLLLRPHPSLSLSLYNWLRLHHPSSLSLPSLSLLLHTLSLSRRLQSAHFLLASSSPFSSSDLFLSLLHTYRLCSSTPQVFDLLFSAYARRRKFRDATNVFLSMRDYGFLPNVRSCNAFLASSLAMGRNDIFLSFYREMRRSRISPNVYTLNMVMSTYCNSGKLDKALHLFSNMESLGFTPTVASFNVLINAHCKSGLLPTAIKLLKSIKAKGLEPTVITYNTLINGLCNEGRLHDATKILNEMSASMLTPTTVTYNILISGYCKANNIETASMLFDDMVKKGVQVNIQTYNSLILGFCNQGKTKKAASLVKELDAANLEPNASTLAALVVGQCQRNNSERAFQVFKAMKKNGFDPSPQIHERLISTLCKNGDYEGAVEVLKELLERCFAPSKALLDELFEGISKERKRHLVEKLQIEASNVFYVWFDAPIGYISITACYTPDWEKWWKNPENVELYQFMGKDNVPFHTVMFPSTLLGTGENWTMMKTISVTEYLNYENGKFSKTKGIGVFGNDAKDTDIPPEVWRYYLLTNRPEVSDTLFTWSDLQAKLNGELLSNLGNFINRVLSFLSKPAGAGYNSIIPDAPNVHSHQRTMILAENVSQLVEQYIDAMENVKLKQGLKTAMSISGEGNAYLQDSQFWKLFKQEPALCAVVIKTSAGLVYLLACLLEPFMPSFIDKVLRQLNLSRETHLSFSDEKGDIGKAKRPWEFLHAGHKIGQPEPLFKELKDEDVDFFKEKFAGTQADRKLKEEANAKAIAEQITETNIGGCNC